ncbi:VanZ family protein [Pedobacter sp. BMA]|uniref:VanZ family protein n=1 Tax=Pedobacter sp. BMA TaxID=1663685 RepID=UPI00064AAB79|nr:VanZ family protein [Pedobacter sp. BMA]KLT65310.1 glycine cleavage system protein H [Pedobacter sp. BMA]
MYKALKQQKWALLWTIVVLVLCNMRMPDTEGEGFFFKGFDKMTHLGFFFVLSVLLFYGKIRYQHTFAFRTLTIFKILCINAIIGGGIELLQWKVFTYRSAEWWDFGCDMLGACMAVFSYVLLHKLNFNESKD